MGLIPSNIKLLLLAHSNLNFGESVLTLGNQEIWATYDEMLKIFRDLKIQPKIPGKIHLHTSKLFNTNNETRERTQNFIHARTFFEMMGMKEYYDMDKYSFDKAQIIHDLNLPVPENLKNKFSLVIDGGTIEHIFDVKQSLSNIVRMTKLGGFVNHICSIHIDHGLYGINPCLLHDFYQINGFTVKTCYIQLIDYRRFYKNYKNKNHYFEYKYGQSFENLVHPHKQMLVFFIAQKIQDLPEIVIPTQGIFNEQHAHYQTANVSETMGIISKIANKLPDFLYKFLLKFKPSNIRLKKI